jgi:uncharacterized protein YuzE
LIREIFILLGGCSIADAADAESDEDKPGVILDYHEHGDLIALEIPDASRRVTEARKIEYETT